MSGAEPPLDDDDVRDALDDPADTDQAADGARTGARPLRRARVAAAVAVLVTAPITAELLSGYLSVTGNPGEVLFSFAFFTPLYGGAAVLVHDIAARVHRGWPARLLLAAAFGILQAGVVDQSLFVGPQTGVAEYDGEAAMTVIPLLGISAATAVAYVAGHVIMSIAVPLAATEALLPSVRRVPLLGPWTTAVVTAGLVLVALLIRSGSGAATAGQQIGAAVVALLVATVALTYPRRQPQRPHRPRPAPRHPLLIPAAAGALLAWDLLPATWLGTALCVLLGVAAVVTIGAWSRAAGWSHLHIGALAGGALLGRNLIGYISPVAAGVDPTAKIVQATVFTALIVVFVVALIHRDPQGG